MRIMYSYRRYEFEIVRRLCTLKMGTTRQVFGFELRCEDIKIVYSSAFEELFPRLKMVEIVNVSLKCLLLFADFDV